MRYNEVRAFKESGIAWLGEIPTHWEIRRVKHMLDYQKGKNPKVYSDTPTQHIYLTMEYLRNKHKNIFYIENVEGLIKVCDDDILLLWDGANAGEFMEARDGYLSSTMAVLSFKNIYKKYARYYLVLIESELRKNTIGMGIPHVQADFFQNLAVLLPSFKEQQEIAAFLDSKCEKIQEFIAKKERLITLLQEKKQALINEVVTKGLHKDVNLKHSGIAWLGEIPTHWEVVRIGLIYTSIGSGTTPQSDNDEYYKGGNIFWINSGDLNDSVLINSKNKITQKAVITYSALKVFPKGSLVIAMYGATIGKVSILGINACTNQACCVLRENKYSNTRFIFYYFIAKRQDLISMAYGGGQPNISQDIIKSFKVPLPPLKEQQAIAAFLDSKISKIDNAIIKCKNQIELMKEYKASLINEAVCGRINIS